MKRILLLITIILLCSACQKKITTIESNQSTYNDSFNTYYGYLIIPKINMKLGFYNENAKLNDVSKNVELIPTGIKNTYLFAAHSGVGTIAYFNDLIYLKKNDEITLQFKEKTNKYKVTAIQKERKTGKISIPNKENLIILTTCYQLEKGYQLTIIASLIKETSLYNK